MLSTRQRLLTDFAEMAALEYVRIDNETQIPAFKNELRWNEAYYMLKQRL